MQAELTSAKLEIDNYKEALKNKKPPGRSSAIPMDENQGFKRAALCQRISSKPTKEQTKSFNGYDKLY